MIVCICKAVSDIQIKCAIDDGLDSFGKLKNSLAVGSQCGKCTCEVKTILQKQIQAKKHLEEENAGISLMQSNAHDELLVRP